MIDERYSFSRFESLGVDSDQAEKLVIELAGEVSTLAIDAVSSVLKTVVLQLNEMGHRLELDIPPQVDNDMQAAEVQYRDDGRHTSDRKPRLRIGIDIVVSTGYAHYRQPEEEDKLGGPGG